MFGTKPPLLLHYTTIKHHANSQNKFKFKFIIQKSFNPMAKLKVLLLVALVLCYTLQLALTHVAADREEERRAKEQEWRRREKTAEEEEEKRRHHREKEEEREWRPDEERRRHREKEEEEEEERGGGGGGFGREEVFVIRESKRVVSTEAGEMRVVKGFGGREFLERWVRIGFISMEPRSLFLPQYLDSSLTIFIRRGEAKIGLIYEDQMGERALKMGDVYRIPAGSAFYIVNTGETQRLQIICSIDDSEGLGFGSFQSFFVGGGMNPVSVLAGFDTQTLSTAFNVSIVELQEVMTSQKAGPIVFADTTNGTDTDAPMLWANFLKLKEEERLERLKTVASSKIVEPKEEEEEEESDNWSWRNLLDPLLGPENKRGGEKGEKGRTGSTPDSYNLFDRDPSFKNAYGWSIALDKHDYSPLKKSGVGLYYVNLTAGSMMAPHVNPTATEYGVVLSGSGTIQIVYPNGSSATNTKVSEGDIFRIPRYFPFCQIASRSGPFEFFGFTTSAHRNRPQFLIGASSILKAMRGPELATSFGVTVDRFDELVDAQREAVILPSPAAAEPDAVVEREEKVVEKVPRFVRGLGKEMLMDLD